MGIYITKKQKIFIAIIFFVCLFFYGHVKLLGTCPFGLHVDNGPATCEKDKKCIICGTIFEEHHGHEYDLRFAKDNEFHECDESLWCKKCNTRRTPTAEHQWVTTVKDFSEECSVCGKINILVKNTTANNNSTYVSKDDEATAISMAQVMVKNELKAPSTASFPWDFNEYTVTKKGNQYTVKGYVDAQNSFGVKIRTKFETCFTVEMVGSKYKGTKIYTLIYE